MVRWRILRTLLWKEALRFRYNLGLLVVIGALLALSALVAVSSRLGTLFGQQPELRKFYVVYEPGDREEEAFAAHLRQNLPSVNGRYQADPAKIEVLPEPAFLIAVRTLPGEGSYPPDIAVAQVESIQPLPFRLRLHYHYSESSLAEFFRYQRWCDDLAKAYARTEGPVVSHFHPGSARKAVRDVGSDYEGGSPMSKIITALVIFAFYLLSFNIYITTTAEEREKRALLAIMLTPARPVEIILAKVLFYATLSVVVSMSVVAMYQPRMLALPVLWLTVFSGAAAYVAIGTVVVCLVRRQTTINNVSMMYLIFTAVIMLLGKFLWGFNVLRGLMVENYLYRHLEQIIDGKRYTNPLYEQVMLTGFTVVWIVVAVMVFQRRGVRIAHASR